MSLKIVIWVLSNDPVWDKQSDKWKKSHFLLLLTLIPRVATSEREETMDASDSYDSVPSAKKTGRTSLLDSGEDFEVLNDEDIDDDPPPLEDAGGGKGKNTDESEKRTADTDPEPAGPVEEWLDVLGM